MHAIGLESKNGICLTCKPQCIECISEFYCTKCKPHHAKHNPECPACEKGCRSCEYNSTSCVECSNNFTMDSRKNCYYKYTVHIIIGVVLVSFVFMMLIKCCIGCIYRAFNKTSTYDNVLDTDVRSNTYFIHHVTRIGSLLDNDRDLSKVIKSEATIQEGFMNESTVDLVLGRDKQKIIKNRKV